MIIVATRPSQRLHDATVAPVATRATKGAWFKHWRLVSIDGSTLDVADEPALAEAFGRPDGGRGESAYPQIRFVSLVENGTHVLFGTRMDKYGVSEIALARQVLASLVAGMLLLGDRNFFNFQMWSDARATGADLLWRVKTNARLPQEKILPDGSYLSHIYPSEKDRRHKTNGVQVRIVEYRLEGIADADPIYRLVTTIFDSELASAEELASLYHERWEIEPSFRDSKDLRFGMGMSALRIDNPQRRDRLLLLNAFAILLLTLLGAAGESLGMDKQLRTSTVKRRVHSLFRQGCLLYELIPNMPEASLRPLVERYQETLRQNASFSETFGFV